MRRTLVVLATAALTACHPVAATTSLDTAVTTGVPDSIMHAPGVATASTTAPPTVATTAAPPVETIPADITPPPLTVTDPPAGASVATPAYRFRGTTEPGATLVAAGRYPVDVASDGTWEFVLMLDPGGNIATFVATDPAGNHTEVDHPVYLAGGCSGFPQTPLPVGRSAQTVEPPDVDLARLANDLDGDGAVDAIEAYGFGDRWYVGVTLSYGWQTNIDVTDISTVPGRRTSEAGLMRVVDAPGRLLVISPYGIAPGIQVALLAFDRCGFSLVLDEAGGLPDLYEGGGINHWYGVLCDDTGVRQRNVGYNDVTGDVTSSVWVYAYSADSHTLRLVEEKTEVVGQGEEFYNTLVQIDYCSDRSG